MKEKESALIHIFSDYYFSIDPYQFALKRKYIATKKKTGTQYEETQNIGYYSSLKNMIEALVRIATNDNSDGVKEFHEYIEVYYKIRREIAELISKIDFKKEN